MDYNKATGEFVLQLAKLSMGLHVLHVLLTESHTFARASRVKLISVEDPLVFSEKLGRKVVNGRRNLLLRWLAILLHRKLMRHFN